jgi:clan AA aspartic protease (TIGR02281 family)
MSRSLLLPLVGLAFAMAPAAAEDLDAALQRLGRSHGFAVVGLDRLRGAEAREVQGEISSRIEALLADFNYAIERGPNGEIARVAVLGRKRHIAPPPDHATVATTRRGRHHVVEALVRGNAAAPLALPLMVDTGASMVVLPASLMAPLGFRADELKIATMQTANQPVEGRVGVLRSVSVGGMAASEVRVAFIEDPLLDGAMLLGMSYLAHFRFTIDDKSDRILLTRTR